MRQAIRLLVILLLAAAAANLGHTAEALLQIEHSVIRLHILADSDETGAQMQKLLVRDALLEHAADWIPQDADFEMGCEAIRRQLPAIRKTALETLRAAGCPERAYGKLTLPAGEYLALRVEIGRAAGQNWWCVMYPAMCIPAAAESEPEEMLSAEACDMALHPEQYEVRLKCVDTVRSAMRKLREFTEQAEAAFPEGKTASPQTDEISAISSRSRYCSRSRCCHSYYRSRSRTEESE